MLIGPFSSYRYVIVDLGFLYLQTPLLANYNTLRKFQQTPGQHTQTVPENTNMKGFPNHKQVIFQGRFGMFLSGSVGIFLETHWGSRHSQWWFDTFNCSLGRCSCQGEEWNLAKQKHGGFMQGGLVNNAWWFAMLYYIMLYVLYNICSYCTWLLCIKYCCIVLLCIVLCSYIYIYCIGFYCVVLCYDMLHYIHTYMSLSQMHCYWTWIF